MNLSLNLKCKGITERKKALCILGPCTFTVSYVKVQILPSSIRNCESIIAKVYIFFTETFMERLSSLNAAGPSAKPQRSSASSWTFRQQSASERWKEARPYHLQCLIEKETVGHPLCCLCHKPAVIRLDHINLKLYLPRVGLLSITVILSALLYRPTCMSFGVGEKLDTQRKPT